MIKKIMLTSLLFSTLLYPAVDAGISILRFAPTESYGSHINRSWGFDVYGAWQPDNSYFGIGGYLQYIPYDTNKASDRIKNSGALSRFNIPVETKSQLFGLGLLLQAIPFKGPIQPYVEGQLGFTNVRTETSAQNDRTNEDQFSSTNLSDTSFTYGYTIGLKINIFKEQASRSKKTLRKRRSRFGNAYIDLKYRRFYSNSDTEFIDPDTITNTNAPEDWKRIKDKITYESFQLGLSATF